MNPFNKKWSINEFINELKKSKQQIVQIAVYDKDGDNIIQRHYFIEDSDETDNDQTSVQRHKASKQSATMKPTAPEHAKKENVSKNSVGHVQNSIKKCTTAAQEAMTSGDRILAESLYQKAEHYLRLNNEFKGNRERPSLNKPAPSKQKRVVSSNDFELSIEQELTIAQSKL